MLRQTVILGTTALTILVPSSTIMRAECTIPPPPCVALTSSEYVFLADVVRATSGLEVVDDKGSTRLVPQRVRFRIVKAFKGVGDGQKEIDATVEGGNAEAVIFYSGNKYLVYASSRWGAPWGTACSRTRRLNTRDPKEVENVEAELRALRECAPPGGAR